MHRYPISQGESPPVSPSIADKGSVAPEQVSVQVLQRPGRKRAAKSSGGPKPEQPTSDATVVVLPRRTGRIAPGTYSIISANEMS